MRAAAFSEQLKQAEVVPPSAAVGLAICIEQKLIEAHRNLADSELLERELTELIREQQR